MRDLNPSRRKLVFTSSTAGGLAGNRIVVPGASGPGDPTALGATFEVYDAFGLTTAAASIPLGTDAWRAIMSHGPLIDGPGSVRARSGP